MGWLTDFVRPKLRALVKADVPDNLWSRCPSCEQMLFHRELSENLHVCHHCNHHLRIDAPTRLSYLFDEGVYSRVSFAQGLADPLKFKDIKKYTERLKAARQKTGEDDALIVGTGNIKGVQTVVAAFNFSFMGGSMGTTVGNGIVAAAEEALSLQAPLVVIPASGGARMQEAILSLMQMARTTIALTKVKEAGLPYVTMLADPTTGGVSASFAMLGDIIMAEPKATIGFAGARVIKETIRGELPKGFQKSEYLLDHGMIDMIVNRVDLPKELSKTLGILTRRHSTI